MKPHLERLKELNGRLPTNIIARCGIRKRGELRIFRIRIGGAFCKIQYFSQEESKVAERCHRVQNWYYVKERDEYICGNGRYLGFVYEKNKKATMGMSVVRVYECEDCSDCPFREKCVKGEKPDSNRRIYINRRLNELKKIARTNLTSENGLIMRSKRPVEVENAFGNIKGNFGVRRFLLRGIDKVKIEWGLYSIAHNMRKIAAARG